MQQAQSQETLHAGQRRRNRWLTRDMLVAMAMLAPSVIAVGVFVYCFIAWTGFVSLTKWNGLQPDFTFVGLDNYIRVFTTGRFQTNIRNLVVFTVIFLLACLLIGLL